MAQPATAPGTDPQFTIKSDGTWSPPDLTINNGGVIKFEVNYPPNKKSCKVTISGVTFSAAAAPSSGRVGDPGDTVTVGS